MKISLRAVTPNQLRPAHGGHIARAMAAILQRIPHQRAEARLP
jgi:hypothetical protein